jgi:ankyrin repeat protein
LGEVRRLILRGAEVDAQAPRNRTTALHMASAAGHRDVVEVLIEAGANVSAQDSDGFTPAQRARENGHDGIVRLLEAAGQ